MLWQGEVSGAESLLMSAKWAAVGSSGYPWLPHQHTHWHQAHALCWQILYQLLVGTAEAESSLTFAIKMLPEDGSQASCWYVMRLLSV